MRLVTFQHPHARAEAGILSGSQIFGLGMGMTEVCAAGRAPATSGPAYGLGEVKLLQ